MENYVILEHCLIISPSETATLRRMIRLAAVARESQEEHPRNSQSQNTADHWINDNYITQVSEEMEGTEGDK